MVRFAFLALAAVAILAAAHPAGAHPRFVAASPARNAVLTAAPREIRVSFSEAVSAQGSSFRLLDAAGKPVATAPLAGDPKDAASVVLPIVGRLAPGNYTVQWTVAAAGHTTVPGRYRFELKP
jgi:methionine-rich copper-binding protein CopC